MSAILHMHAFDTYVGYWITLVSGTCNSHMCRNNSSTRLVMVRCQFVVGGGGESPGVRVAVLMGARLSCEGHLKKQKPGVFKCHT